MKKLILVISIFFVLTACSLNKSISQSTISSSSNLNLQVNEYLPLFAYVITEKGNKIMLVNDCHINPFNNTLDRVALNINLATFELIERLIIEKGRIIIGTEGALYPQEISLSDIKKIYSLEPSFSFEEITTFYSKKGLVNSFKNASMAAKILYPEKIKIIGYEDSLSFEKALTIIYSLEKMVVRRDSLINLGIKNKEIKRVSDEKLKRRNIFWRTKTVKELNDLNNEINQTLSKKGNNPLLSNRGYLGIKNFENYINSVNKDGIFIMGTLHSEEIVEGLLSLEEDLKIFIIERTKKDFSDPLLSLQGSSEEKENLKMYKDIYLSSIEKIKKKYKNEDKIVFIKP